MKPITLHPISALSGGAIAALALLALGAGPLEGIARVGIVGPVQVEGHVPHPRDWVVIRESEPLTVPAGKIFVLTALGTKNGTKIALEVDGLEELRSSHIVESGQAATVGMNSTTVKQVPAGFSVSGGLTILLRQLNGGIKSDGRAWGYLVDE